MFARIRENCGCDIPSCQLEALFRDEKDPVGLSGLSMLGRRRVERVWEAEKREVYAGDRGVDLRNV